MMVATSAPTSDAVAYPTLEVWPTHGDHEHGEGKRNGDARDIENIAERGIRRRRTEILRVLQQHEEHYSSDAMLDRKVLAAWSGVKSPSGHRDSSLRIEN